MTETTSFWWQVLRKAGDLAYNVGVEIVTDRTAIEDTLLLPPGAWREAAILGNQGA